MSLEFSHQTQAWLYVLCGGGEGAGYVAVPGESLVCMIVGPILMMIGAELFQQGPRPRAMSLDFSHQTRPGYTLYPSVGERAVSGQSLVCMIVGPIPMMIGAELFRQGPRPRAMSLAGLTNWTFTAVVALTFELVQVNS